MSVVLRFENPETVPQKIELGPLPRSDVPLIMDWYGAYHAGDDYKVFLDGVELQIGINGEFVWPTIDGEDYCEIKLYALPRPSPC